jgi:hypothetical protein
MKPPSSVVNTWSASGDAIPDALDRVRRLAGEPWVVLPSQSALDELLAGVL